jgi:hypothetical protein
MDATRVRTVISGAAGACVSVAVADIVENGVVVVDVGQK